ncbi:MAG TPA: DUF2934 domain-containing protein [Burkholderiales bacterium]|nr:DUF2934 domain-containing protein [Burkholderiales bacterium]
MKETISKESQGAASQRPAARRKSPEERWVEPTDVYRPADSIPESEPTREERIAVSAYYKAERRGFAGEAELDDWLEAEREVDADAPGGMQNEEER